MKRALCLLTAALFLCGTLGCKRPETTGAADIPAQTDIPEQTKTSNETEKTEEEQDIVVIQAPVATITMEDGSTIKLELYYDVAPNTVKNFISLANSGFYDGVIFHRVIPGFMIQGGDPTGTGTGGPGYRIKGEFSNNRIKNDISHERGVISMARQGNSYMPASAYNTAGSQFFIMHADSPFLDKDYAAFGSVTEGIEVVDAIAETPCDAGDKPLSDQVIKSIRVDTFGVDFGEPEKIID